MATGHAYVGVVDAEGMDQLALAVGPIGFGGSRYQGVCKCSWRSPETKSRRAAAAAVGRHIAREVGEALYGRGRDSVRTGDEL